MVLPNFSCGNKFILSSNCAKIEKVSARMALEFLHISFPQVLIFMGLFVQVEKIFSFSTLADRAGLIAKNNY